MTVIAQDDHLTTGAWAACVSTQYFTKVLAQLRAGVSPDSLFCHILI